MAPTKKGGKKKGLSAINETVTGEYVTHIHKPNHGVGFRKHVCPSGTPRDPEISHKGDGNSRCTH